MGFSFGTAPGGVRVINIRFDEDEWETRWAKVPHATLRHPETRAAVTLIGTAHISKAAAEEDGAHHGGAARRGGVGARPAQAQRPRRGRAHGKALPSRRRQVRVDVPIPLRPTQAIGLAYTLVGALLGTTPGAEFLAAIDAAKGGWRRGGARGSGREDHDVAGLEATVPRARKDRDVSRAPGAGVGG